MDPFLKKILEKAEQRSKIYGISNVPELVLVKFEQPDSFSNEATVASKYLDGYSNSKSTSPCKILRKLSIDKENLDIGIEIDIPTKPNVEVQVEEEEEKQQTYNEEKMSDKPIRDSLRNKLLKLCALHSDVDDFPPAIHRNGDQYNEENTEKQIKNVLGAKPKRNLDKLAALADSVKSWEYDTSKKQQSRDTQQNQITSNSVNKPKQFKWNVSVIQKRDTSTTKLSYNYANKYVTGSNANTKHITAEVHRQQQTPSEISSNQSILDIKTPEIKPGLVSSKTAVFETQPKKSGPKEKDPAEMSLKEKMMLFERNKGKVPLPKTTFALPRKPMPSKSMKNETGNTATVIGVEPKKFDTSRSDIKVVLGKFKQPDSFSNEATVASKKLDGDSNSKSKSPVDKENLEFGLVLSRIAIFETQPKKSAYEEQDPSEMSLKEKIMLMEKKKCKAAFASSRTQLQFESIKSITGNKATFVGVEPKKFDTPSRSDIKGSLLKK